MNAEAVEMPAADFADNPDVLPVCNFEWIALNLIAKRI
jgi:hypothetical protein